MIAKPPAAAVLVPVLLQFIRLPRSAQIAKCAEMGRARIVLSTLISFPGQGRPMDFLSVSVMITEPPRRLDLILPRQLSNSPCSVLLAHGIEGISTQLYKAKEILDTTSMPCSRTCWS